MIVADSSGLLALFIRREPTHPAVRALVDGEPEPLVVSPYVVAELDYLVATRLGVSAELAMLAEVPVGHTTWQASAPRSWYERVGWSTATAIRASA